MRQRTSGVLAGGLLWMLVAVASPLPAQPNASVKWSADSEKQAGVPEGAIHGPFEWKSEIFPGTVRNYWVYVPQQYDAGQAACVFVVQDGLRKAQGWRLPTVLDNLIHRKEVPVQIGIFIEPGVVPAPRDDAQPRFNRSFEYDALGDRYARFLLEEILPEVGKSYNLSTDPNHRAIGGTSSGAICAFNVAWERPNEFRRVLSAIGTYVGLRGADVFPTLVRKHEAKPIRVYLQDGSQDLNIYAGDWWMANQSMLSALQYANYEVQHHWTEGNHSDKDSAADLPNALRFLWKGYPDPVATPAPAAGRMDILIPGEDWIEVSSGHRFTEGPAVNKQGELFFTDIPNNRIHKIGHDGAVTVFAEESGGANGLMFGPDGKLYACQNKLRQIGRYDAQGQCEAVVTDVGSNDLVVLADGSGYFTDPETKQVGRFSADGRSSWVDKGIERPNGVIVSPDQTLLTVADTLGKMTWSFQIRPDGRLTAKQQYGWLHLPEHILASGADGMTVDTEGRLYVATHAGIQILDQPGRVHLILSRPENRRPSNVVLGGPDFDILYATCGEKVFRRKVKSKGVLLFEQPIQPPTPRL